MEDNTPVQRITAQHVKIMVDALNAVHDSKVSPAIIDYTWYSQSVGTPRLYTLMHGDKVLIQGMRAADFYFACNAIAETIIDTLKHHASTLVFAELREKALKALHAK